MFLTKALIKKKNKVKKSKFIKIYLHLNQEFVNGLNQ